MAGSVLKVYKAGFFKKSVKMLPLKHLQSTRSVWPVCFFRDPALWLYFIYFFHYYLAASVMFPGVSNPVDG